MKTKIKLTLIFAFTIFLPGCSTWDELVSIVDAGWETITCWVVKLSNDVVQSLIDFGTTIITSLVSILPSVDISQPNLDNGFLSSLAFFLPISEMATIAVSVFTAIGTAYAVFVILRWLKIIK